jgi:hypothetical protein
MKVSNVTSKSSQIATFLVVMSGRVVDRDGDSTIESFEIYSLCVGLVEPYTIWVVSSFGLDPPD